MLEGILVGIFGNTIFTIIQSFLTNMFHDKDEDLNNRIYESLEAATEEFFKRYGDIYKTPHNSFIARESNIRLIVNSLFYGNNINLIKEIDRRGFEEEPNVSDEHLHFFIVTLNKIMKEDYLLDKIITEKIHIQESKEANENIKEILETVTGQSTKDVKNNQNKAKWQLTDIATGREIPFIEGKKYHQKFPNGVEYIFMFNGNNILVDFKDIHGRWSYHELDLEGNAKNNKFPYPISDYKLVVNENDIINRTITPLANGFYQEVITLKWNRISKVIYDKNNEIQELEVSGGWKVSHDSKTISPADE